MIFKNIINYILYLVLFTNTSVYSSNIETHLNLREIMKDAEFSCTEDEVVAKWVTHENINEEDDFTFYGTMYYSNNKDNLYYHSLVNVPVTKYDKVYFLKEIQEDISLLNFKTNNKLHLSKFENNMFHDFISKNHISFTFVKDSNLFYKYQLSISNDILNRFYNDIREIKQRNIIIDVTEQLKIDIYNQQQDMNKFTTKYDEEFKLMHNYFLNKFYQQNCITSIFKTLFNKLTIKIEELYNNIDDHEKLLDK